MDAWAFAYSAAFYVAEMMMVVRMMMMVRNHADDGMIANLKRIVRMEKVMVFQKNHPFAKRIRDGAFLALICKRIHF